MRATVALCAGLAFATGGVLVAAPAGAVTIGDCQATGNAWGSWEFASIRDTYSACTYLAVRHSYWGGSSVGYTAYQGGYGDYYQSTATSDLQFGQARIGGTSTVYNTYTIAAQY